MTEQKWHTLEFRRGNKVSRGLKALIDLDRWYEPKLANADALWWREGQDGPWCVYVFLTPQTPSRLHQSLFLSHRDFGWLKRSLRDLGFESDIRSHDIKVVA